MNNPTTPLGIPAGSVRAILAILVTGCAVACVIMQTPVPDWFIGAASAIIANYFTGRGASEATKIGARSSLDLIAGTPTSAA